MLDLGFSQIKLKYWRYTHAEIKIGVTGYCSMVQLQLETAGVVNNEEGKQTLIVM